MNTIKVIYNNKTDFIVDIANDFDQIAYVELFNYDSSKTKGKIRKMQKNFGSKNFPLIIIQDENLDDIDAIWSESNPEWAVQIGKKLRKYR